MPRRGQSADASPRIVERPLFDDPPEHEEEERIVGRIRVPLPTDLCQRCQFPRSDHFIDNARAHAHYQDYQNVHPRMMRTTCHDPYCHMVLCSCMMFVEIGEVPVSSFAPWWIKENGLLKL